ncbi:MAG: hypothetical protein JWP97_6596 [Labilithrix sp.]|nr:hypothetical protein [Labilithrix sp.]
MGALRHVLGHARLLGITALVGAVSLASGGCRPGKKKVGADASASASARVVASVTVPPAASVPPAPPRPVDPLAPRDRALVERTKANVREVDALVKKETVAENGVDAGQKCEAIEEARDRIASLPDDAGDLATLLAETKRLCSFEVPILSANAALKQAGFASSQASHKLVCDLAQKEFLKARAAKPNDRKTYDVGSRLSQTCK